MKTRSQTAAAAAGGDDGGGEDPRRHMKAREELFRKLPLSRPGLRKLKVKPRPKEARPDRKGARNAKGYSGASTTPREYQCGLNSCTYDRGLSISRYPQIYGAGRSSFAFDHWLTTMLDSEVIWLYEDKEYDQSKNIIVVDDEDKGGVAPPPLPPLGSLGSEFDSGSVFDASAGNSSHSPDDEASSN